MNMGNIQDGYSKKAKTSVRLSKGNIPMLGSTFHEAPNEVTTTG